MKKILFVYVVLSYLNNKFDCGYKAIVFDGFETKSETIKDEKAAREEYFAVMKNGGSASIESCWYNRKRFDKAARMSYI